MTTGTGEQTYRYDCAACGSGFALTASELSAQGITSIFARPRHPACAASGRPAPVERWTHCRRESCEQCRSDPTHADRRVRSR